MVGTMNSSVGRTPVTILRASPGSNRSGIITEPPSRRSGRVKTFQKPV